MSELSKLKKFSPNAEMMVVIGSIIVVYLAYKADSRLREQVEEQRETTYQVRALRHELEVQNPHHPRGGLGPAETKDGVNVEEDVGEEDGGSESDVVISDNLKEDMDLEPEEKEPVDELDEEDMLEPDEVFGTGN